VPAMRGLPATRQLVSSCQVNFFEMLPSVKEARGMQFSGPTSVSLFPPLRRARARVGVKAGGVPRPCFSPHPDLPPPGGKGSKTPRGEEKIENCMALQGGVAGGCYLQRGRRAALRHSRRA